MFGMAGVIRFCPQNALRLKQTLVGVKSTRSFITSVLSLQRLYTDKHEWILVENSVGTVGISDYAQKALGDIVYVGLPEVGAKIAQHDEAGSVESVKSVSEVFSPVSGSVTAVNDKLSDNPALINKDCYGEGWLYKLKLKTPAELESLMDEAKYQDFLKSVEAEDADH